MANGTTCSATLFIGPEVVLGRGLRVVIALSRASQTSSLGMSSGELEESYEFEK